MFFFTPNYRDADERAEAGELIRSVGPQGDLFYKPDIFSVLNINSQNQWGFKVTTDTYRAEDRLVYESRYYMKRRARGYRDDSDNDTDNSDSSGNDSEDECEDDIDHESNDDSDMYEEPQPKKKRMKKAEEWAAEAQEANTAEWISFEIRAEGEVPISSQREMLTEWLDDNRPGQVGSWDGVGWIVIWKTISPIMILDFKAPKAEWDSLGSNQKNMKSINDIAKRHRVKGILYHKGHSSDNFSLFRWEVDPSL